MTMKTDKYKVSQELMVDINEWRNRVDSLVVSADLKTEYALPLSVYEWWLNNDQGVYEKNNRLIALIRYVNGEDVFEVDKPNKWVVKSSNPNDCLYITIYDKSGFDLLEYHSGVAIGMMTTIYDYKATKFDTKEEAEQFTNPLMEVVEA